MFEHINRRAAKAESRAILRDAQVSPRAFFALYLGATVLIQLFSHLASAAGDSQSLLGNPLELFIYIFSSLLSPVLMVGIYLYCMAIRRGERAEYLVLFDGFSFTGKIVLLWFLQGLFVFLWTLLFVFPGIVAAYRYSFAYMNLCRNPSLSPLEALRLSKAQTSGYKFQLFQLDLSYFGWIVLASLPTVLLTGLVIDPDRFNAIAGNPLYIAVELACFFLFSLLYMPGYYTTQVGYYETAVRTSGADPDRVRRDEDEDSFFF